MLTRLIPIEQAEASYARNRLVEERPPWPKVGDQVYFRRNSWGSDEDLFLMRIVDVQSPDDIISEFATNLCQHLRDMEGRPQFFPDGTPVIVPLPDPWPWVKMIWEGELSKNHNEAWKGRPQITFESRLRGSPGWLPLDYGRTRVTHMSYDIPFVPMPAYRFNGERLERNEGGEGDEWLPYHRR